MSHIQKQITERVIVLLITLTTSFYSSAQCIYWQVPLRNYSAIERIGHGLYRVTQSGKMGIINHSGETVIPVEFDAVEPFYENQALVLNKEGTQERIIGFLTTDGRFTKFAKKYYALAGQKFFSEGLLTVANEQKKLGYIDEEGNEVLGFNKGYTKIKPFTEGYASVFKGKNNYQLITQHGTPCRIILGLGEIYGGTNVYDGKAIVWDSDGTIYEYQPSTGACTKAKKISSMSLDYLYCLTAISGRTKQIPYATADEGKEGLAPSLENGVYGFKKNDKVLLPAQFASATPFIDNISVVSLNGKYGLLRYSESGSPLSANAEKKHFEYAPGTSVICSFQLMIPAEWNDNGLNVSVKNHETGELIAADRQGNNYSFKCTPKEASHTFDINVSNGEVTLWNGQEEYTFKKVNPIKNLIVSIQLKNDKADADDKCYVIGSVHNPNSQSITATITMKGSAAFANKVETVTIPAGSSHSITSYFIVKKNLSNQSVTITTNKGGNAAKTGLDLIPFYTGG